MSRSKLMMFGPGSSVDGDVVQVDDEPGTVWLKSTINPDVSAELLIASRRYTHPDLVDRNIWLVGVSHIGESDFYESLSELMADHDLVLYESVMEQASRGASGDTPESRLLNTNATMHWLASLAASVELTDGVAARSMDDLRGDRSPSIVEWSMRCGPHAPTPGDIHLVAMNGNQSSICSLGRDGLPGGRGSTGSGRGGHRWLEMPSLGIRNQWPEVSSSTINCPDSPLSSRTDRQRHDMGTVAIQIPEEGIQLEGLRACSRDPVPGGDREGTQEIPILDMMSGGSVTDGLKVALIEVLVGTTPLKSP